MTDNEINEHEEILRELDDTELTILVNLYRRYLPNAFAGYCFIKNQLHWNKLIRKIENEAVESDKKISDRTKFIFYTHRHGDLKKHGTYVGMSSDSDYHVTFFTLQTSQEELRECIFKTKLIKYNLGPTFCSIEIQHLPILNEYLEINGINKLWENFTGTYMLKKSMALSYEYVIPEEIEVKPLCRTDAVYIDKTWPHKYMGSELFIQNLIDFNGGYGVYLKSNNELLAWILKNEFSGLGLLYTVPNARGKGYGSVLIKVLSKTIAEDDSDHVIAHSLRSNYASRKLLFSLGYYEVCNSNWMEIEKKH